MKMKLPTFKGQKGAAVLMMTVFLMTTALLLLVYQARFSNTQMKVAGNQLQNAQAFEAAEAGLQYGMAYFQVNFSTIIASASGGIINHSLSTITLGNSSHFVVTFSNQTANNYNIINIVSAGTSSDGTASRTVQQQESVISSYANGSVVTAGSVTLIGGSSLRNTITNINIQSGGSLTINNGAATYTSSGQTTSQGHIGSDVQQNLSSLSSLTEAQFFQTVFGVSEASAQASASSTSTYYNNSVGGGDYSQTLKSKSGVTIYVNQSQVTLGQGVQIGTPTNPVTIIVQGNLTVANGVTIYGFIYASGTFTLAGGATITGAIASYGSMNISNGFNLNFNQVPKLVGGTTGYAPIAGSWRDF